MRLLSLLMIMLLDVDYDERGWGWGVMGVRRRLRQYLNSYIMLEGVKLLTTSYKVDRFTSSIVYGSILKDTEL